MKNKGVKIVLIIILVILVIALVNFMIYAIINRNNDYSVKFSLIAFGDNTEKIFEKEYKPEELDKINVDVSASNVFIEKVDVDKIKVTAYGEKDEKINETINDNELSITKSKTKVFIFAMLYWCDEKIIIQVPNECDEDFNIHTSSGDIVAPNLENNVINFETSSGKIECGNIKNGNFKSSSGDITVGSGNEITIQTSSGSIKAGNFNKLSAEASSGEIDINKIEEYCNLVTSSGNIDIESLNIIENSFISARSGNVDINGKNDIYVETETTSGDADVKNNNRMAKIVLKITTTSGNIRID